MAKKSFLQVEIICSTTGRLYCLSDCSVTEPDMSACFCPDHKAPMVLFLDRVYGIEDQSFLLHLLEVGFLPDLRAATSLDTVGQSKHKFRQINTNLIWHCEITFKLTSLRALSVQTNVISVLPLGGQQHICGGRLHNIFVENYIIIPFNYQHSFG